MQARSSDGLGQLAHSTPAPHRRCSAVAPRTRRRVATSFRFPIQVGRSVCCPIMTTADAIGIMLVPSLVRIGISLCPRCFRCVSDFCPNSLHAHAMHVPLTAHSQATQVPEWYTHISRRRPRMGYALSTHRPTYRQGIGFSISV